MPTPTEILMPGGKFDLFPRGEPGTSVTVPVAKPTTVEIPPLIALNQFASFDHFGGKPAKAEAPAY